MSSSFLHVFFSSWVVNPHLSRGITAEVFPISKDQNLQKFRQGRPLQRSQVGRVHVDVPVFVGWKFVRIGWKRDALVWEPQRLKQNADPLVGTSGFLLDDFFRWQMKGRES